MTVPAALQQKDYLALAPDDHVIRVLTVVQRELSAVRSMAEAKAHLDRAALVQELLQRRHRNRAVQNKASLVCVIAERQCGILDQQSPPKRGRPPKSLHDETISSNQATQRIAISALERHRWRKLTTVTVTELEELERECTSVEREFTRAHVWRQLRSMLNDQESSLDWEQWEGREDERNCRDAFNRLSGVLSSLKSTQHDLAVITRDRGRGQRYLSDHHYAILSALARDAIERVLQPLITES